MVVTNAVRKMTLSIPYGITEQMTRVDQVRSVLTVKIAFGFR